MRYNKESLRDYERQLDIITAIPSNKVDNPNLNLYSQDKMEEFEIRHLNELAEQARRYDINEQKVVAENLDPFILYNALGSWLSQAREQLDKGASIFNQGGNDGI